MKTIKILQNYSEENSLRLKIIGAFVVIYFVWGSTYLAIRLAIETIPPFLMMGIRFTIAGILLYGWCYYRSKRKPDINDWKKACITGLLMIFCGYACVAWAQQFITSGLTAVLLATLPIWMVLLDWVLYSNNRPGNFTLTGISLGIVGVGLLFGMDENVLINTANINGLVILSSLALTFGGMLWAAGSIYIRNIKTSVPIHFFAGMQLLVGGSLLILFGLSQGEWSQISLEKTSTISIIALSYLIIMGSLVAYSSYIWLLKVSEPAKVGTYTFFNPLIAVILGYIVLDEQITTRMAIGAISILVSLLFVNQPQVLNRSYRMIINLKSLKRIIKNEN